MSQNLDYSLPLVHQQKNGMSPESFAALHNLSIGQLYRLIKKGFVLGASKHPLTKKWWIYPPAKLLQGIRQHKPYKPRSESVTLRGAGPSPAVAAALPRGLPPCPSGESEKCYAPLSTGQDLENSQTEPLAADLRRTAHAVFESRKVKEAVRDIGLAAGQSFYPVVLSGAQMLCIERALQHEGEALKLKLEEVYEFEPEARSVTGEKLENVYTVLRVLKSAASVKNRCDAVRENTGVTL